MGGCGATTTDEEKATTLTPQGPAPATGELMIRRSDTKLEVVRVDVATGTFGAISEPLPYEATTETFPILSKDAASGRIVVEVGKKIFAMDAHEGSLGTWRTLADDAFFVVPSADASLVSYSTNDEARNETTLHVVRYGGENVLDVTVPSNPVDSYPKPTLSPTGQWVLVSRALGQLEAYTIPAAGRAGDAVPAPAQFNVVCTLPSTFMGYDPSVRTVGGGAWFDARFQPVPGFVPKTSQVVASANEKRCLLQVDVTQAKPSVFVFDDRAAVERFSFDAKLGDLVDVRGDTFLSKVPFSSGPSVAFGKTATSEVIAKYVPAPPIASAPANKRFDTQLSVGAHRLSGQRLSVVVESQWSAVTTDNDSAGTGVNAPVALDSYVEVFSVNADGSSPTTVRLATAPAADNHGLSRFAYRFSHDGRAVYWMADGGLKVRDVAGGDERTIAGDFFVGAARD